VTGQDKITDFDGDPLIVWLQTCLIGLVSDLVMINRKILEEMLYRVRELEIKD